MTTPDDHLSDTQTEKDFIGALLLDPNLLDHYGHEEPSLFGDSDCREVYRRMQENGRDGLGIHPIEYFLAPRDSDDDRRLRVLMNEAYSGCPSHLMAKKYVNDLRELARKRKIKKFLEKAAELNYNGNSSLGVRDYVLTSFGSDEWEAKDDADSERHPLDVPLTSNLHLGWVDQYADFMTELTGSPREFNVLAGLTLVGTVLQRRAYLHLSFGDIYPNVYAAIIAPSSVYHKSSSLAKPRALLKRAMLDNLLLAELMTSEGLTKQLSTKSCGLIVRDEIGTLFASHTTKYLAHLKPDVTALYDGQPYSRRLSNEEVVVKEPYLNILGATTPERFFGSVQLTDWKDGFLARWLFTMPDQEPDFDTVPRLFTQQDEIRMGQLAVKLMQVDREPPHAFQFEDDSFTLWADWQSEAARQAYHYNDDTVSAIVSRYANYALKFSLILAAAHGRWGVISPEIMQTSIDLAENFKAAMYRILTAKANHGVSGQKLQKVFAIIHRERETGVTTKLIYQRANMVRGECQPVLDKLTEIGACRCEKAGNGFRYFACTDRLPIKAW